MSAGVQRRARRVYHAPELAAEARPELRGRTGVRHDEERDGLRAELARLDAMDTGRPCYVLFEGAGADGSDLWSRCEIVEG